MTLYIGGMPLDVIMLYKTGPWGEQAKTRSKKRLEYFREYQKERHLTTDGDTIKQSAGVPIEIIVKAYQNASGLCEQCGEKGQLIHHIDKNHNNNILKNLQILCRGCHNVLHNLGVSINSGENNPRWTGDNATQKALYKREWIKKHPDYRRNYRNRKKQEKGGDI